MNTSREGLPNSYNGKELTDICPVEKSKKIIKNCPCHSCQEFCRILKKQEKLARESKTKKLGEQPAELRRNILSQRQRMIAAIALLTALAGTATKALYDSTRPTPESVSTTPNPTPELQKKSSPPETRPETSVRSNRHLLESTDPHLKSILGELNLMRATARESREFGVIGGIQINLYLPEEVAGELSQKLEQHEAPFLPTEQIRVIEFWDPVAEILRNEQRSNDEGTTPQIPGFPDPRNPFGSSRRMPTGVPSPDQNFPGNKFSQDHHSPNEGKAVSFVKILIGQRQYLFWRDGGIMLVPDEFREYHLIETTDPENCRVALDVKKIINFTFDGTHREILEKIIENLLGERK